VAGADDAVMLDSRGFVAETNATHLFAVIDAGLVTPRTVACPEGITRQTVLALAAAAAIPAEVRDLSLTELYTAEEVFCTGTMGEIAGVVAIDGRSIGDGEPGALTRRVADLYRDHVRAHATPLPGLS
jgi:branched-chain amino acid aminotransferase